MNALALSPVKSVHSSSLAAKLNLAPDLYQVHITSKEQSNGREIDVVVWVGESTDRARVLRAARRELKRLQAQG